MPEIPFALQWIIPENQFIPIKDSTKNECLASTTDSNTSGCEYFLRIYPNGNTKDRRGRMWIYLYLKSKNGKKIDAKWNLSIESANFFVSDEISFQENVGLGFPLCETKDFFDPEMNYIVNGECTVKLNGTFKFENENPLIDDTDKEQQNWNGEDLGDELWTKDGTKDFTIVVEGNEIKVHKIVLDARSNVFSSMLNSKVIQSIEIPDFSFDVVQTAIKMIYNCNFTSSLSSNDQKSLLKFFEKYDLPKLKAKVEQILIDRISTSNVCRLTNYSKILDQKIASKILQNSVYKNI